MSKKPIETKAPPNSKIVPLLVDANFHDAWTVTSAHTSSCALDLFLIAVRQTPKWTDACMRLRNSVAKTLGLKDLGGLDQVDQHKQSTDYQPGDRVGIFTLIDNDFDEVLLGDDDKHLKVVVSLHRQPSSSPDLIDVTITTVVHTKNALGRLYMIPVKPMHRLIAPSMLSKLS
jgi:hypothetical protein